jgi:hypothetical protein
MLFTGGIMIKSIRILFFALILSILPGQAHAYKWHPFKRLFEKIDCAKTRKQATESLANGNFELAAELLEKYISDKDCNASLQDKIDLIFSHYKSAGLDGGALSRSLFIAIDEKKELMGAWKTEQPAIQFTIFSVRHLSRAIQLHESLDKYYDHDAYFFKLMAMRSYRAAMITLALPVEGMNDEVARLVFADLMISAKAMAKTTKYRPEIVVILNSTATLLDQDRNGSADSQELKTFSARYR